MKKITVQELTKLLLFERSVSEVENFSIRHLASLEEYLWKLLSSYKKITTLLFLALLLISGLFGLTKTAYAVLSSGPNSPGTMADDATVGTVAWTNPDNTKVSDNVYAVASSGTSPHTSHYLKATNFGFSIPSGATINGILVEIERKDTINVNKDANVKIVKADGTIGTTDKADTVTTWPTTDTYKSYGSSSDLWGETWTPADINDVDFGVVLAATLNANVCLNEDSLISTPNGYVKIKELKIGDSVLSYNDITKKVEPKIISNVTSSPISQAGNKYFYIYYNNGEVLKATGNHKFYVEGNYIEAQNLKIGDKLLSSNLQEQAIEKIEIIGNTTDKVWDLAIEDNHNFFANDILVHNIASGVSSVDYIRITVYYTDVPTITSPTNTSVIGSSATLGGNVTSDGGGSITGRGVCVGTSANPALGGNCFSTSGTTGVFTVSATSLIQGTLYHYRAYATNSIGTSYTSDDTFTTLALDNYLVTTVTPQTAGVCVTGTNTVTARDSTNATITTDSSTVNMTSSGTGVTFYTSNACSTTTTQYTLSSGVANIYYKTNVAQSFTITATKASSTETGTSSSITVDAGPQTRLVVTLPGETFTATSGNSGTVTNQAAGSQFTITKITATDDYFNIVTGYSGSKTLAYSGPSLIRGAPSYTTSVSFTSGQSTTALLTTLYYPETTTITVTDGGQYGYASDPITVESRDIRIKGGPLRFKGEVRFK